jgi:hypothetical protein
LRSGWRTACICFSRCPSDLAASRAVASFFSAAIPSHNCNGPFFSAEIPTRDRNGPSFPLRSLHATVTVLSFPLRSPHTTVAALFFPLGSPHITVTVLSFPLRSSHTTVTVLSFPLYTVGPSVFRFLRSILHMCNRYLARWGLYASCCILQRPLRLGPHSRTLARV